MFKVLLVDTWFHEGLPEGVRLLMKPVDDDAEDMASEVFRDLAAYDGDIVVWEHEDTKRAARAYDVALMAACVVDWEGVGNATGKAKLDLTIEATRAVIAQKQIYGPLWVHFLEPYHYRISEKNVSAPLPKDTSAGAMDGGTPPNSPEAQPVDASGISSASAADNSVSAA